MIRGVKDISHYSSLDDSTGVSRYLATTILNQNELVVGRYDALYFFNQSDRGQCYGIQGEKSRLFYIKNNLIIVGKNDKGETEVTIYDIQNKYIGYAMKYPKEDIYYVTEEWGVLYLITSENHIYSIKEKDTQTKLETLFQKNLYQIAISIAQSAQYDYSNIVDIYRRNGDFLYDKGEYDNAIEQYIYTIGHIEPSYVIQKFLDVQRIHNLTAYMEAIHEQGKANEDHTTLLINCYTKLKESDKLKQFIHSDEEGTRHLKFDATNAINVLRSANCHQEALYLAKKHNLYDFYIKILCEDICNYSDTLAYIGSLAFMEAEKYMIKYGKTLVSHIPVDSTTLLKKLCTHYIPSDPDVAVDEELKANPEDFIQCYVDHPLYLKEFLEYVISIRPQCDKAVWNTLLELLLKKELYSNISDEEYNKNVMDLLEVYIYIIYIIIILYLIYYYNLLFIES